jgi:hypothetical protein
MTRRIDENAPPSHTTSSLAPSTRSRTTTSTTTTTSSTMIKPAGTTAKPSGLPVMKRQNSSALNTTANGGTGARSAFGEVSNATKAKKELGGVLEKKVTGTTAASRRTRSAAVTVEAKKEVLPLPSKRKATTAPPTRPANVRSRSAATVVLPETKPLATSTRQIKALPPSTHAQPIAVKGKALIPEPIAEPARKRRKTSTPPPDEEDELDEAHYDEDGKEVVLSSGGRAVSRKSPERVTRAKDDGWTDLDGEDEGDPTMVSEYVVDAFNYMLAIEVGFLYSTRFISLT